MNLRILNAIFLTQTIINQIMKLGQMHQGLSIYHLPGVDINGYTTMEKWLNSLLNMHLPETTMNKLYWIIRDMVELTVNKLNMVILEMAELVWATQKHMTIRKI